MNKKLSIIKSKPKPTNKPKKPRKNTTEPPEPATKGRDDKE